MSWYISWEHLLESRPGSERLTNPKLDVAQIIWNLVQLTFYGTQPKHEIEKFDLFSEIALIKLIFALKKWDSIFLHSLYALTILSVDLSDQNTHNICVYICGTWLHANITQRLLEAEWLAGEEAERKMVYELGELLRYPRVARNDAILRKKNENQGTNEEKQFNEKEETRVTLSGRMRGPSSSLAKP